MRLAPLCMIAFLCLMYSTSRAEQIFDGGFEGAFPILGITADQTGRQGQVWHDQNPSLFIDPAGPNTGWFLQSIPGVIGGGSVDVVSESAGFGVSGGLQSTSDPICFGDLAIDLTGTPNSGALNQIIETVAGVEYELSFWLSSNQQNQAPGTPSDRIVDVFVDGSILDSPTAGNFGTWLKFSVTFTASGPTAQIGFFGRETPGTRENVFRGIVPGTTLELFDGEPAFGALLDNVSVVAVSDPTLVGDLNLDGAVTFSDIPHFIVFLQTGKFQAEADADQNGEINFLDIPAFIAILRGQ